MSLQSKLQAALARYQAGDLEQARAQTSVILTQNPDAVGAMNLMAMIEFKRGERGAALKWFRQAVELSPRDTALRFNYAKAAQASGAGALARSLLAQVVGDDPDNLAARHALALAHWENGDLSAAEEVCRAALARAPNSGELLAQMSALLFAADRWHEAVAFAERAVAAAPGHVAAQRLLGEGLGAVGRYSEATMVLKACQKNPATPKTEIGKLRDLEKDAHMLAQLAPEMRASFPAATRLAEPPPWLPELAAAVNERAATISGDTPTFVFFHVAGHDRHPFLAAAGNAAIDYATTLAWAARAARATNPAWRVVVLSDAATPFAELPADCQVVRLPIDPTRLMHSRMRAYRALLHGARIDAPVVLLDTDACVNRDLASLFDGGFDVGLTYRHNQFHMPVNEGVILGANGTSPALASFFDQCLTYYDFLPGRPSVQERYPFDVRVWRGGQLSLATFVDWRIPPLAKTDEIMRGVRCRFLPCDEYNYPAGPNEKPEVLAKKHIVHFKGAAAKQAMSTFCANLVAGTAQR